MNCLLFVSAVCVSCAVVLTMVRAKFKVRYSIAVVLLLVAISLYFQLSTCRLMATPKEQAYSEEKHDFMLRKSLTPQTKREIPINRRELLRKMDTINKKQLNNKKVKKTNKFYHLKHNRVTQNEDPILVATLPQSSKSRLQMIGQKSYNKRINNEPDLKTISTMYVDLVDDKPMKENLKVFNISLQTHQGKFKEGYAEKVVPEIEEIDQEKLSPKRSEEEVKKAPKRNGGIEKKSMDFFQINMEDDVKNQYLFDNQKQMKLLPHLTPQQVKGRLMTRLPWWEATEIDSYPRVWFVGEGAAKIQYNKSDPSNYGFDYLKHDEARLKIVKADHLEYRYEIIKKLGTGSYGTVVQARDHAVPVDYLHHMVAVKVMHNDSSAERYFKEELDLMKLVHDRTNNSKRFSTVLRTFFFRNHLCIVMELLGKTLDDIRNGPIQDLNLLRKYTLDILRGLTLLHEARIIHGDLKPENLMLAPNSNISSPVHVKIADFNLACIQGSKDFPCPGRYFQTRYYRAPEVVLELNYSTTADMWSVGVILAELYLDKVPFYGESSTDQLASIMEVMGLVPPYMVEASKRIYTYQEAVCYECKNGFNRIPYRKSLTEVLQGAPPLLFEFIKQCLELDYNKRISSKEAILHPFMTSSY